MIWKYLSFSIGGKQRLNYLGKVFTKMINNVVACNKWMWLLHLRFTLTRSSNEHGWCWANIDWVAGCSCLMENLISLLMWPNVRRTETIRIGNFFFVSHSNCFFLSFPFFFFSLYFLLRVISFQFEFVVVFLSFYLFSCSLAIVFLLFSFPFFLTFVFHLFSCLYSMLFLLRFPFFCGNFIYFLISPICYWCLLILVRHEKYEVVSGCNRILLQSFKNLRD